VKGILDAYTMRARLVPAILAGAPAFALAIALVSWGSFGITHVIATLALTALFAAFSDVARRRGKAIEPELVSKMGGLPTTTMLRHRDTTIDEGTKKKIHTFIGGKLGEAPPAAEHEAANPELADIYYARGATWLRENTRDVKKFGVPWLSARCAHIFSGAPSPSTASPLRSTCPVATTRQRRARRIRGSSTRKRSAL